MNFAILSGLKERMQATESDKEFSPDVLNKECSKYLFEQSKTGNALKSEDVFFLVRFALTGNPVGAPIGEISEVIGRKATLERLEDASNLFQAQIQ